MSDEYFLIKGTLREFLESIQIQDEKGFTYNKVVRANEADDGYYIRVEKLSLTEPTLTKPKIRVPVWGQEFVVQGVKMEKGVICVDVTPPLIKDMYGTVLPAMDWTNDVITVKTPPDTKSLTISEANRTVLEKENEKLKKEHADTFKKMEQFRENYRLEHERGNKLQDSEAAAKRELKTAQEELKQTNDRYWALVDKVKEIREWVKNQLAGY